MPATDTTTYPRASLSIPHFGDVQHSARSYQLRTYPGRRRIAVLVFTAVVPASLTGCGGKTGSTTAPSGAAAQSGGVASTRPAPLPTQSTRTTLSGPGLLTLVCSSLNAPGELRLYDPSNAGQLSSLAVPEATPNGTVIDSLCGPSVQTATGLSKLLIRQRFNRDFSLIAYVTQMQADGSVHVGYTPLTGSAPAVDVTAATSAPGFGSTPPHDLNPVFDPDSSSLFFARSAPSSTKGGDDLQIFRYDLGTGTAAVVGAANVDVSSEGRLRESITVQAGHPVLGDLLLSPDGAVVATKGRGPDDQGGVRFFATPAGLVTDLPHQDPMGALEPRALLRRQPDSLQYLRLARQRCRRRLRSRFGTRPAGHLLRTGTNEGSDSSDTRQHAEQKLLGKRRRGPLARWLFHAVPVKAG